MTDLWLRSDPQDLPDQHLQLQMLLKPIIDRLLALADVGPVERQDVDLIVLVDVRLQLREHLRRRLVGRDRVGRFRKLGPRKSLLQELQEVSMSLTRAVEVVGD